MRLLGKSAGVFGEPAGVTGTAGLAKAAAHGLIPQDALVVSIVTGNGLKDVTSAQKATGMDSSAAPLNLNRALRAKVPLLIRIEPDMALLTKEFSKCGL